MRPSVVAATLSQVHSLAAVVAPSRLAYSHSDPVGRLKPRDLLSFDQTFDRTLLVTEPCVGLCRMATFLTRLLRDDSGVTAIEYGLILALIVVGSLIAINTVGVNLNLNKTFSIVASSL